MSIHKLSSTDAFIVFDLDNCPSSVGFVRCAPKLLASSSAELARSTTYTLALHGLKLGGATASINTGKATDKDLAIKAFSTEIAGMVAQGQFLPDVGKGIVEADLSLLRADDWRNHILFSQWEGMSFQTYLRGVSAAVAVASAAGNLGNFEGRTVALEGFDSVGLAASIEFEKLGGRVVAVSTPSGCVQNRSGFELATLKQTYLEHNQELVKHLDGEVMEPEKIFGIDCDVLLAGSKFGVVDHHVSNSISSKVLGSLHHLAFTTRGLVELQKKEVAVLPDFLCLGGPLHVEPSSTLDQPSIIEVAKTSIDTLVEELKEHPEGIFLGACYKAEEFLLTWREELPFGRPLAP